MFLFTCCVAICCLFLHLLHVFRLSPSLPQFAHLSRLELETLGKAIATAVFLPHTTILRISLETALIDERCRGIITLLGCLAMYVERLAGILQLVLTDIPTTDTGTLNKFYAFRSPTYLLSPLDHCNLISYYNNNEEFLLLPI